MSAPEKDVPESVSYREVQEILRTFRDSAWRSITLDLHGMRITVGKDGPPAAAPGSAGALGSAAPGVPTVDGTGPGGAASGGTAPGGAVPGGAPDGASVGGPVPPGAALGGAATGGAAPGNAPAGGAVAGGVASAGSGAGSGTAPPPVDTTGCVAVRSPAVGAFWIAPSPGQPPFVQVGQAVAQDEQLAIVEVMKLMNPVVASTPGEVVAICAANADLVEYEQVLFWIRPAHG